MINDVSRIQEELAPFADLGTDPPKTASDERRLMIRVTRDGEEIELQFDKDTGKVAERSLDNDQVRNYASYRSLLASDRFGNLRQWANNQRRSLQKLQSAYNHRIPVASMPIRPGANPFISIPATTAVGEMALKWHAVVLDWIDQPRGSRNTAFTHAPTLDPTTRETVRLGTAAATRDLIELWVADARSCAESVGGWAEHSESEVRTYCRGRQAGGAAGVRHRGSGFFSRLLRPGTYELVKERLNPTAVRVYACEANFERLERVAAPGRTQGRQHRPGRAGVPAHRPP